MVSSADILTIQCCIFCSTQLKIFSTAINSVTFIAVTDFVLEYHPTGYSVKNYGGCVDRLCSPSFQSLFPGQ